VDVDDEEIPYLFYRGDEPPHVAAPTGTWIDRAVALADLDASVQPFRGDTRFDDVGDLVRTVAIRSLTAAARSSGVTRPSRRRSAAHAISRPRWNGPRRR